ncbi:MAG: hypothetical protein MRY59_01230 [Aquisalinus sp.]|nr:hypothetical protein [Aquisalinus sp.]
MSEAEVLSLLSEDLTNHGGLLWGFAAVLAFGLVLYMMSSVHTLTRRLSGLSVSGSNAGPVTEGVAGHQARAEKIRQSGNRQKSRPRKPVL